MNEDIFEFLESMANYFDTSAVNEKMVDKYLNSIKFLKDKINTIDYNNQ